MVTPVFEPDSQPSKRPRLPHGCVGAGVLLFCLSAAHLGCDSPSATVAAKSAASSPSKPTTVASASAAPTSTIAAPKELPRKHPTFCEAKRTKKQQALANMGLTTFNGLDDAAVRHSPYAHGVTGPFELEARTCGGYFGDKCRAFSARSISVSEASKNTTVLVRLGKCRNAKKHLHAFAVVDRDGIGKGGWLLRVPSDVAYNVFSPKSTKRYARTSLTVTNVTSNQVELSLVWTSERVRTFPRAYGPPNQINSELLTALNRISIRGVVGQPYLSMKDDLWDDDMKSASAAYEAYEHKHYHGATNLEQRQMFPPFSTTLTTDASIMTGATTSFITVGLKDGAIVVPREMIGADVISKKGAAVSRPAYLKDQLTVWQECRGGSCELVQSTGTVAAADRVTRLATLRGVTKVGNWVLSGKFALGVTHVGLWLVRLSDGKFRQLVPKDCTAKECLALEDAVAEGVSGGDVYFESGAYYHRLPIDDFGPWQDGDREEPKPDPRAKLKPPETEPTSTPSAPSASTPATTDVTPVTTGRVPVAAPTKPAAEPKISGIVPGGLDRARVPKFDVTPTNAEWDAAREVVLSGSTAAGCEVKVVGMWFRAVCKGTPEGLGRVAGAQVLKGGFKEQTTLTFDADKGELTILTPFVTSANIRIVIAWQQGQRTMALRWPLGAERSRVVGAMLK